MPASKVIEGFKVEVEGTDCFISRGKFCSSLAAVQQTGTLESSDFSESVDVPESVQINAEKFALANGW